MLLPFHTSAWRCILPDCVGYLRTRMHNFSHILQVLHTGTHDIAHCFSPLMRYAETSYHEGQLQSKTHGTLAQLSNVSSNFVAQTLRVDGLQCNVSFASSLAFFDLPLELLKSGMPPHPGPACVLNLAIQNISSFMAYSAAIFDLPFDALFCQETSLPSKDWQAAYDEVKSRKHKAIFTNTDPELDSTGGLGALFKQCVKIIQLEPVTKQFASIHKNGRVQLVGICLPRDIVFVVANIYGCRLAATRTNQLGCELIP